MRILAISRKVGRPKEGIQSLSTFYETGFTRDVPEGIGLVFRAPTLKEAAPKLLDQPSLFGENLNPEDTVFDFLNDAIVDVRAENKESIRFDKDLLSDFSRLRGSFQKGIDSLQVASARYTTPTLADRVLGDHAEALLASTPAPQRVRIAGQLDMVRVSDSAFELIVSGPFDRVKAVWIKSDPEELGHLLKQTVLVEGDLVFKANGKPLRMEAEYVRPARASDNVFASLPKSVVDVRRTHPAHPISFKQLIGSWPGEESDEELRELLEAMS